MENKKFIAILAKNQIARQIYNSELSMTDKEIIYACLKDIEDVIGESNQPSVISIILNDAKV